MNLIILLGLLLAGTAAGFEINPALVQLPKAKVDLITKSALMVPIKTVKVPYYVTLQADTRQRSATGLCHLEYQGLVLARHQLRGAERFEFKGAFVLNEGVNAVQLRCQLDGFDPLLESVELIRNTVRADRRFNQPKLFQEALVDLDQGIARVRLKIPGFRQEKIDVNGKVFMQLSSDHQEIVSGSFTGEPLLPEFPMTHFFFALPMDARVIGMTVKAGPVVGGAPMLLAPKAEEGSAQFQGPIPLRFDEKAYFSSPPEITPEKHTRYQTLVDRETNLVKVSVPLLDFFVFNQAIRFYEDIEITIRFRSESRCFRPPFRGRDTVDLYRSRQLVGLNQLILNPQDVLRVCRDEGLRFERNDRLDSTAPIMSRAMIELSGPNLVIVSPDAFKAEAEVLRQHKETLGIRTSTLLWNGTSAEDLKAKLAAAAQNLRPNYMQWVLLLGDVDRIPTYYDEVLKDPKLGDYALSAGDVYYTQFTEQPATYTPSMDPKFSIGRIPAKTAEELQQVLSRIIAYENNPPILASYYQSPTLTATLQMNHSNDTGSVNNYAELMENTIAQPYIQAGFRPERIFRTDTELPLSPIHWSPSKPIDYVNLTRSSPEFNPQLLFHMDGSQEKIDNAMKRGTSILINRGHASTQKWAWPSFGYEDARFSLFPADKPPVVFAISCLTGFFDSETIHMGHITSERSAFQTTNPVSRYLAEQLLLGRNGALGVVASTRQSTWSYNNRLTRGLGRSLIDRQNQGLPLSQRLGDVMVDAKVFAKKINGSIIDSSFLENTNRHHLLVYNLLGDPSVEIRQSAPMRVRAQPAWSYDAEKAILRLQFRVESLVCPGCDLSLQTEQPIAVLMDASNRIINRALATPIQSESGANREIVLTGVNSFYGNLMKIYLSNAGLIPYQQVIDNRIQ